MERISMSASKKLMDEFNKFVNEFGYKSRSKAISDALKTYMVKNRFSKEDDEEVFCVISTIYNPLKVGIFEEISECKFTYLDIIRHIVPIIVSKNFFLEYYILFGKIKRIKEFGERLIRTKHMGLVEISINSFHNESKFPNESKVIEKSS